MQNALLIGKDEQILGMPGFDTCSLVDPNSFIDQETWGKRSLPDRLPSYLWILAKLKPIALEFFPETKWQGLWSRTKFLLRALAYGSWMEPWLQFLELTPMRAVADKYPRLYLKIQWPYMNDQYGPGKRLQIIQNHYQFALDHFSSELFARLFIDRFMYLAKFKVGELGVFSLRLSQENKFCQEGEMVLGLYHDDTDRFCALLCFSITEGSEISIGCLQGGKPVESEEDLSNKDLVVALTRGMHGLRPKNLLLFVLRQLVSSWSITRLKAVSTERHVWKHKLQADYNTFWEEAGGTLGADGMYDLPSASEFKDLQEIKPKKRSMYRNRYQFLEALGQEIFTALAVPDRVPVVVDVQGLKQAAKAGTEEPVCA